MDTSEIYIEMCDAPEIQNKWKSSVGDFTTNGIVSTQYKNVLAFCNGFHTLSTHFPNDDIKWLPRQDQIQEMMPPYDSPFSMAVMFGIFCDNKEMYEGIYAKKGYGFVQKFETMEQLWLAFYMYEKHSKIWTGKEWEKKC